MRIVFSRLAEIDLEEIADYIARDDPRRALSFVRELRGHCGRIAEAPQAWPARPELGRDIRCSVHGRYVVFFHIAGIDVLIVRILHGARDIPSAFEGTIR